MNWQRQYEVTSLIQPRPTTTVTLTLIVSQHRNQKRRILWVSILLYHLENLPSSIPFSCYRHKENHQDSKHHLNNNHKHNQNKNNHNNYSKQSNKNTTRRTATTTTNITTKVATAVTTTRTTATTRTLYSNNKDNGKTMETTVSASYAMCST